MKYADQHVAAIAKAIETGDQEMFDAAFSALESYLSLPRAKPPRITADTFPLKTVKTMNGEIKNKRNFIKCGDNVLMTADYNNDNGLWEFVHYIGESKAWSRLCI